MAPLPPVTFQVTFTIPAEMRWAMRAKGEIEATLQGPDPELRRPLGT